MNKLYFFLLLSLILIDFKGLKMISYLYKMFFNYNYLNIYIITHKDFKTNINNQYYKILCDEFYQIKNKYELKIINTKKDNDLFKKKIGYSEGSKIYYIWKQFMKNKIKSKYVGFNHYSRIFSFNNDIPNLDNIFKKYDIILNKQLNFTISIKKQYYFYHNKDDIDEILEIIKYKFPQYYSTAVETLNSKCFHLGNIFIMKKKDFINYGIFTFGVLFEFDKRHHLINDEDIKNYVNKNYKKYRFFNIDRQRRLEGYLMERISNIFYNYNFKKKYEIPTLTNENYAEKKTKNPKFLIFLEIFNFLLVCLGFFNLKKKEKIF